MADRIFNAAIFLLTLVIVVRFFRKDGTWSAQQGKIAFRYFTVQSNVLCAVGALCLLLAPGARWAWMLKYVGTAAVSVTMLTVLFFLGPTIGYGKLLQGADFFLHLVLPLLALVSFCVLERRVLSLPAALTGLLPVALYSVLYIYRVLCAPESRRWEDFYGFNKGGKWPLALAAMLIGTLLICLGLMALQNR
ncbi:MAG: hypothetical protein II045_03050 [Oscillospiraceae bacterium]|nr:hypothetical protein [Oscillospiraceae bacterium]